MKLSRYLKVTMAGALASAALVSFASTSASAATATTSSSQATAAAPSSTRILESGLTEKQAYDNSVAILQASQRELASSKAAQADSLIAPQAAASGTNWPSYFSNNGLEGISCVLVVSDAVSCNTAKNLAQAALNLAAARYPSSVHNGRGDAFRHAYWNATMYVNIGASATERIAGNHEAVSSNPQSEKNMDLYNNAKGRSVGMNYRTTAAIDKEVTRLANTPKNSGGLQQSL